MNVFKEPAGPSEAFCILVIKAEAAVTQSSHHATEAHVNKIQLYSCGAGVRRDATRRGERRWEEIEGEDKCC